MKTILIAVLIFICYNTNAASLTLPPVSKADSGAHYTKAENRYPTPALKSNTLFYIQRDPNSNTILYELNTESNGTLNPENPVHVYWIKYNERGQKEELNFIQRKFAYGVNARRTDADNYDIRLVSYKKFPMSLMKAADGKYHIFANIDKKQAILKSVFVRIEGGSFWIPNVLYVEVKGTDPETGKEVESRFKP